MGLPAVKHLDPVVGVDVHAVIVAPEPVPVYLPHPYVGFVLDLREYIDAALGVIGSIAFTFVVEEVTDYLKDNPDVANELDHALKSAATDLKQADTELMSNPLIAGGVKLEKEAAAGVKRAKTEVMSAPLIAEEVKLGKMSGSVAVTLPVRPATSPMRPVPVSGRFLTLSLGEASPSMEGAAKTRLLRQYRRLPAQSLSDAASSHPMTRNSAYARSIRFGGAVDCVGRCPTKKTGRRMTAVLQEATKGPRSYD